MARKRIGDPLLADLKENIRKVLDDPKSTPAERLKAIEVGTKLLMIQHRITGDDSGTDGKFFGG